MHQKPSEARVTSLLVLKKTLKTLHSKLDSQTNAPNTDPQMRSATSPHPVTKMLLLAGLAAAVLQCSGVQVHSLHHF